jgi:hypothetical protein
MEAVTVFRTEYNFENSGKLYFALKRFNETGIDDLVEDVLPIGHFVGTEFLEVGSEFFPGQLSAGHGALVLAQEQIDLVCLLNVFFH